MGEVRKRGVREKYLLISAFVPGIRRKVRYNFWEELMDSLEIYMMSNVVPEKYCWKEA